MRNVLALLALMIGSTAYGQWLPDQSVDRALWERTGVPLEGLKFYKARRVSQRLSIVNDVHVNGIYAADYRGPAIEGANPNAKQLWAEPGGLHWSPRETWRNATAVYLPAPVEVYRTTTQVKNSFGFFQTNAVIKWRFPDGTVFADLLIRRADSGELPFELRLRRKVAGQWESEAYRPFDEATAPLGTVKKRFAAQGITDAVGALEYDALMLPDNAPFPSRFVRSAMPVSGGFLPRNYAGPVARCSQCHDRSGESGSYAGVNAPGSDGVIGFSPFTMRTLNTDAMPEVDSRWAKWR